MNVVHGMLKQTAVEGSYFLSLHIPISQETHFMAVLRSMFQDYRLDILQAKLEIYSILFCWSIIDIKSLWIQMQWIQFSNLIKIN